MALLDTVGVTATNLYKERVLGEVFRYTGNGTLSTTEMQLTVVTTGTSPAVRVKFRSGAGSVYISGYEIAIPAGGRVIGFEIREIDKTDITATVSLAGDEVKYFEQQGILYIDEIRFSLNVSLNN